MFLGSDDVINMLAFLANIFQLSFKYLAFLTQIRKDYVIFVIMTSQQYFIENLSPDLKSGYQD